MSMFQGHHWSAAAPSFVAAFKGLGYSISLDLQLTLLATSTRRRAKRRFWWEKGCG